MSVPASVTDESRTHLHRSLVAVALAVVLVVGGVVLSGVLGLLMALLFLGAESGMAAAIAVIVAAELGYLVLGAGYLELLADGVPLSWPSLRQSVGGVLAAVALVAGGQALLQLVPGAGIGDVSDVLGRSGVEPRFLLVFAVVAVVLVGPAEELLFRGGVQGTLRPAFGPVASIAGASILFTAVHVPALVGRSPAVAVLALGVIFAASVVFGYAFERTGSLAVPILVHSLYDGLLLFIGYLLTTGVLHAP